MNAGGFDIVLLGMDQEKNQKTEEELTIETNEEGPSSEEKVKKLKKELTHCLQEKAEYLEGWQRARADFINAKKEEKKSREEFVSFSTKEMLREFLSLADSFEMAFRDQEAWNRADAKWREGVKRIYKQLMQIFERFKVAVIEAKGSRFNLLEHESIEEVGVDDKNLDGIVLEEVQRGYKIHDQVLRPARVKVGIYKRS